MTAQIPIKAIFTGSTPTALGQFGSGDTIDSAYLPAQANYITATAGAALDYPRVVCVAAGVAYYPDLTNSTDVNSVVGVTLQAAASGDPINIATQAEFTESGWGWSPGAIYCAVSNGTLTQTAPTTGAVLEVAKALSSTSITVLIHRAILRN